MQNILDTIACEIKRKRIAAGYTQAQLADKLHMNPRTIIDLEKCRSNPKLETVVLIVRELNISLDSILFPNYASENISKSVVDFFANKSESEIQKYITLCQQADKFKTDL